jgi:hypothetical protein
MSLSDLRAAIKGKPGNADVVVHLPGGRTLDIASIDYTPADPGTIVNAEPSINIWVEEP